MRQIRVVTYNIHKGLSFLTRKKTLVEIRRILEELNADIVCLQEIGSRFIPDNERRKFETQLEFLGDLHWPHSSYIKNATYPSGHHGNAILSRWPILKSESVDLSLNSFEKRGLLHAVVQLEEGCCMNIMCTHLNLLQIHRKKQLEKVKRYIDKIDVQGEPVIFAGDFNDWREKVSLGNNFHEAFLEKKGHYARSFPSFWPRLPLDRIYFQGIQLDDVKVIKSSYASDHLPLLADFFI